MRVLLAAVLVALAFSAQASFDVEPIAPTDKSFVVLRIDDWWRDGCVPISPQVTRTGNRIEVLWQKPEGGCTLAVEEWETDVPLGVLPAGDYELVLKFNDWDGVETITTRSIVVSKTTPQLLVAPNRVSATASTDVTIGGPRCFGAGTVVTMEGIALSSHTHQCRIIATLPPHAPGSVSLRVQAGEYDHTAVAAVRYIDPATTPDASSHERVLVPLLFRGPGAHGSQWEVEAELINPSDQEVAFSYDVSKPLTSIAPRSSASLDVFGNRETGLVLFVPRDSGIQFGGLLRDRSRDASQWGTELPIVRESATTTGTIHLPNVPFDPRYRLQLRVYGIDGAEMMVNVKASRDGQSVEKWVRAEGPCSDEQQEPHQFQPCNSNRPAHVSLDLGSTFPGLAGKGRHRIEVFSAHRIWAFVSVTNNDTQHVTLITPQ